MAYIKDKELVMNLQKRATSDKSVANFLLKLPDMSEEEANKALNECEAKENEVNNFLEFLNKDELEAIDGYNKGLKLLPNSLNKLLILLPKTSVNILTRASKSFSCA